MGSSESAQRRCRSRANTEGVEMSVIAQVKVEVEVKRESCEVKVVRLLEAVGSASVTLWYSSETLYCTSIFSQVFSH